MMEARCVFDANTLFCLFTGSVLGLYPESLRRRGNGNSYISSLLTMLIGILLLQVNNLQIIYSDLFKRQEFKTFKVAGQETGIYKNAGRFSYVRIFGAGHEVPAYKVR